VGLRTLAGGFALGLLLSGCATVRPVVVPPGLKPLEALGQEIQLFSTTSGVVTDFEIYGDTHKWAYLPLVRHSLQRMPIISIGYADILSTQRLLGLTMCNAIACTIRIDGFMGSNAQVATLLHELAHVKAARMEKTTEQSEVLAEAVAYLAAKEIAMDTHVESFSYMLLFPREVRDQVLADHGILISAWAHEFAQVALKGKR
jgi:hypothetical protein